MDKFSVSVIIPTRDRPEDLREAVRSVALQSRPPDELLIIDQSRGDESKQAVAELLGASGEAVRLKYIHDSSIAGLVAAKAVGAAESSGDIIFFLEDDVVLDEDYVANMLKGFVDSPDMLGCCGVVAEVPNPGSLYKTLFRIFHRGIFYDRRVGVHGNPGGSKGMVRSSYLSGGLSAYRREVFVRVPFDTKNDFFMLEDIAFSTRAAREFGESRFFINTSARLEHRMSPVNRERLNGRYERKLREYMCFYKLNKAGAWSLPSLIWLLAGLFSESIIASLKSASPGPFTGACKGFIKGIRQNVIAPNSIGGQTE